MHPSAIVCLVSLLPFAPTPAMLSNGNSKESYGRQGHDGGAPDPAEHGPQKDTRDLGGDADDSKLFERRKALEPVIRRCLVIYKLHEPLVPTVPSLKDAHGPTCTRRPLAERPSEPSRDPWRLHSVQEGMESGKTEGVPGWVP